MRRLRRFNLQGLGVARAEKLGLSTSSGTTPLLGARHRVSRSDEDACAEIRGDCELASRPATGERVYLRLSPLLSSFYLLSKYEMPNPDLSVRITLPYQDCSGVVQKWYTRCTTAVCYEHQADEDITQTHVHLALIGLDCKTEALKRMCTMLPGKGNEFWSFTPIRDQAKYFSYMTKGNLTAKIAKNISETELEKHRTNWVDPVKDANVQVSPTTYYIRKVLSQFDDFNTVDDLPTADPVNADVFNLPYNTAERWNWLFKSVRSTTMKVYFREVHQTPHTSMYKTVASTVFMTLAKRANKEDAGIQVLLNSWY